MELFLDFVFLILGSLLILGGANYFTSGSSTVAKRLGVSDFVIGLTLVSVGSSAPDLAVGIFSALKGHTQFALGNVVGSCVFDSLLVVGCITLVAPLQISRDMLRRQLPNLILAYIIVLVCANAVPPVITRVDGILMLLFFFMILRQELNSPRVEPAAPEKPTPQKVKITHPWLILLEIVGGLGALIGGGDLFVKGAAGIATHAHISETVIGLTVVALGTSLPDLATSVVAAVHHRPGMAIGNVVGSCMMDALLVLGCSAITAPLPLGGVSNLDLGVMLGSGVLLVACALISRKRQINKWEGGLMILLYATYVVHTVLVK